MRELAPGVWQLHGRPSDLINTCLLEGVLIDAGTRFDGERILQELRGRTVSAHALTHAHPDHLGSSHLVCERLGIPFWVGAEDAAAAANPAVLADSLIPPRNRASARRLAALDPALVCFGHGPPVRDARRFREFADRLPAR